MQVSFKTEEILKLIEGSNADYLVVELSLIPEKKGEAKASITARLAWDKTNKQARISTTKDAPPVLGCPHPPGCKP